jgi:hypothetical protein
MTKEQEAYLRDLRRSRVQSGLCCNKSISVISRELNIPLSTCHGDKEFLRKQARENIAKGDEVFAERYQQCLDFLSEVMLEAWESAKQIKYERNKASLLNIAKDCVLAKAALISDVGLIDRTIVYIEGLKRKRKRLTMTDTTYDNEEDNQEDKEEEDQKIETVAEEDDGGHAF